MVHAASLAAGWAAALLLLLAGCSSSDGSPDDAGTAGDGNTDVQDAARSADGSPAADGSQAEDGGGISREDLTPEQRAALDACEQETGNASFEGCPIQTLCSTLTPSDTIPVTVTFDPLTGTCPWDMGDNDPQRDGYNVARVEQSKDLEPLLEVPEGERAVFCSVDISVEPLEGDSFRYDDDLALVFGGTGADSGAEGGALLVTRNDEMPDRMRMPEQSLDTVIDLPEDWPLYQWAEAKGTETSNENPQLYCLGHGDRDSPSPQCSLPETQQPGDFTIDLKDSTAKTMGVRAAINGNYNLTAILTGDDNPDIDCQHNGFEATVDVGYIVLPEEEVDSVELI